MGKNVKSEPFKPINTSLCLCDNKFHTEDLSELYTNDIGKKVRERNFLQDTMGNGISNIRDQGSLRCISNMLDRGGSKLECCLVEFCVFVTVFLWWLTSYIGKSGA
jgi:hypothetical protein